MAANAKNHIAIQFSNLFQTDIDWFCSGHWIDPSFDLIAPDEKVSSNKCLEGKILAPVGVDRIMHFEINCRCLCYEPSLKMFRLFFRLACSGNWFTIEKTQCETPLITTNVGHTTTWKEHFFFVSDTLIPFVASCHKFDISLDEKEVEPTELESELLLMLRASCFKLRAYPEEFLMLLGISARWIDPASVPSLLLIGRIYMRDLDFIMLDDFSDTEIVLKEVSEGWPSVIYRTEHVRVAGDFAIVSVQPVVESSGVKKVSHPFRRSTRATTTN
ncbi:hypothetical protein Hanom_Chr16g01429301 [Helianthus anomalus]